MKRVSSHKRQVATQAMSQACVTFKAMDNAFVQLDNGQPGLYDDEEDKQSQPHWGQRSAPAWG